jgi:DNA-binding response OmpR family regulator
VATHILVVDDNPDDYQLLREAFREVGANHHLEQLAHARDVFVRFDRNAAASSPVPKLILLDINLPAENGKEVLRWLKSHPVHRSIPVVMYSSSDNTRDRAEALELGAAGFIKKPATFDGYLPVVRAISDLIAHHEVLRRHANR